ncbi:MAG: hypothetical protein AAFV98_05970 [Chloroflexota bacterium]
MANNLKTRPITHYGICPTCNNKTGFELIGVQTWPKPVAEKMGMPMEQTVWRCMACDTTLMEPSIEIIETKDSA